MKKKRLQGYSGWFYSVLMMSVLLIAVTGWLMIPTMLEFKLYWDVSWRLSSESRWYAVVIHILASWCFIFLCGALWQTHIRGHWKKKKNRMSGLTTLTGLAVLVVSGALLYYVGSESAQVASGMTHTAVGVFITFVFTWHVWHGAQVRKRKALLMPSQKIPQTEH